MARFLCFSTVALLAVTTFSILLLIVVSNAASNPLHHHHSKTNMINRPRVLSLNKDKPLRRVHGVSSESIPSLKSQLRSMSQPLSSMNAKEEGVEEDHQQKKNVATSESNDQKAESTSSTKPPSSFKPRRIQPVSDSPRKPLNTATRPSSTPKVSRRDTQTGVVKAANCPVSATLSKASVSLHSFAGKSGEFGIFWMGPKLDDIFVIHSDFNSKVESTNLYQSNDGGFSFVPCPSIKEGVSRDSVASFEDDSHSVIFAAAIKSKLVYRSVDLRNFSSFVTPVIFDTLDVHPTKPDYLIATQYTTNELGFEASIVYVSSNALSQFPNFVRLSTNAFGVTWLSPSFETASTVPTLFYTEMENTEGRVSVYRFTAPFGNSNKALIKQDCYAFYQMGAFSFVEIVPNYDHFNEEELYVSNDEGKSFHRTVYPLTGYETAYDVVNADEGVVFTTVQHSRPFTVGKFSLQVAFTNGTTMMISLTKADFTSTNTSLGLPLYYSAEFNKGCDIMGGVPLEAEGQIVLLDRGNCSFLEKVYNAEDSGAAAVIIINSAQDDLYIKGDGSMADPYIPAYGMPSSVGGYLAGLLSQNALITGKFFESDVHETIAYESANLYHSDTTGITNTLVLPDVAFWNEEQGMNYYPQVTDFFRIESVPGTYIANYVSDNRTLLSFITFNRGAEWNRVPAPEGAQECLRDHGVDCSLHLALNYYEQRLDAPAPSSAAMAIGIILANGFVGDAMVDSRDMLNSYISIDAGRSWSKILSGPHSFLILDHGSVLIAAPLLGPTATVFVSFDEGASWQNLTFSSEAVTIQGMVAEPSGADTAAFIYFISRNSSSWMGVKLEFAALLDRPCNDLDYYDWDMGCVLGAENHVDRRTPCSICMNGLDHEVNVSTSLPCPCDPSDFMCNAGFSRGAPPNEDAACVPLGDFKNPWTCNVFSSLIEGDSCSWNDIAKNLSTQVCHPQRKKKADAAIVISGISIGFAVLIVITALLVASLAVSQKLRSKLILAIGVEGCLGRMFSRFPAFRKQEPMSYAMLSQIDDDAPTFDDPLLDLDMTK